MVRGKRYLVAVVDYYFPVLWNRVLCWKQYSFSQAVDNFVHSREWIRMKNHDSLQLSMVDEKLSEPPVLLENTIGAAHLVVASSIILSVIIRPISTAELLQYGAHWIDPTSSVPTSIPELTTLICPSFPSHMLWNSSSISRKAIR